MLKKLAPYYIALTVIFVLTVSLLNAKNDSAIFDEIAHIPAGYSYLTEHDMRLNPEHPPLIKALSAVPLLFLGLNFDTAQPFWTTDINGQWDAGRSLLYTSGNDWNAILFWSRVPIILLSVILGLFLFWWGKRWLGYTGGLIAFTLAMYDPNILGHNHYVTTDVGIAAFIAFSLYFFLECIKVPSWKNVLVGGFFLGLVHLSKFSSVLLLPLFFAVIILYPLFLSKEVLGDTKKWKKLLEYIGKGIVAFVVSMIVVYVAYAGFFYNTPKEMAQKTVEYYFPASDIRPFAHETNVALMTLTGNKITQPLGEYLLGVAMVFKRVAGGNGAYFMGEVSSTAFPAYFPTVFILKETLVFLALLVFAKLFAFGRSIKTIVTLPAPFWKTRAERLANFMRNDPTIWAILGFVVLYAYLSITGNLNIGFRHLFPILPFLYLFIAKEMTDLLSITVGAVHKTVVALFGILLALLIITTVWAYPYYMSYFNPIAGDSMNGYQYVTDSNADWGQDLNRLTQWIDEYNLKCQVKRTVTACQYGFIDSDHKIRVDYFGGGDILKIVGSDRAILWWDSKRPIEPGWYAVSVNFSQGSIYDKTKSDDTSYRWLKNYTPVAQVGTSIFIYYIPQQTDKEIGL